MIVDAHTWIWDAPGQLGPLVAQRASQRPGWARACATLTAHEQALQELGCALVLGYRSRRCSASISAQHVAAAVAHRPDQRLGLAGVDPADPDWRSQIDEAATLGLVGAVVSPAGQGFDPAGDAAMACFAHCLQRRWPVVVLPGHDLDPRAAMELAPPVLLDPVLRSLPDLRLLIAGAGWPWPEQTLALMARHRHVMTDLTGLYHRPTQLHAVLLAAQESAVLDRIVLGSGFPFVHPAHAIEAILTINRFALSAGLPPIDRQALEAIISRDTLAMLGLQPPSLPRPIVHDHDAVMGDPTVESSAS